MNKKEEVVRVRLSTELKQKATTKAEQQDRSLSEYIRELIKKDNRR